MNNMVTTDWERRSRNGGLIAIVGGVLTGAGAFLPWVTGGGYSVTGWKVYDLRRAAGENPFVVDKMFKDTFDPYVTGAPVVAVGVLLSLVGAAIYAAKKVPPPSRHRISPVLYISGMLVGIAAFLMVFLDIFSTLRAPGYSDVSIGLGLLVSGLGVVAAMVGIGQSAATRRERARGVAGVPTSPPAGLAPQPAAHTAPAAWYQDPFGHHQMRYWDGVAWSSHVSDSGVQSEDHVSPTA